MAKYVAVYGHIWSYIVIWIGQGKYRYEGWRCCIVVHHTRIFDFMFVDQFFGLDGPYLALLGPLLTSRGSCLTPRLVENRIRPSQNNVSAKNKFAKSKNSIWVFVVLFFCSDGIEHIIKRSASKFRISWYQWRVKRSCGSKFMAKILGIS